MAVVATGTAEKVEGALMFHGVLFSFFLSFKPLFLFLLSFKPLFSFFLFFVI